MAAIARAHAAYDAATAGRAAALEAAAGRWERELAAIQRIEQPELRRRMTERGLARHEAERAATRERADAIEAEARAARDAAVAGAEPEAAAGGERAEEGYRARLDAIERAHERAVRAAGAAHGEAGRMLARAAAGRRATIEQAGVEATSGAHE